MFIRRLLPAWFQATPKPSTSTSPAHFQETETEYGMLIDLEAQRQAASSSPPTLNEAPPQDLSSTPSLSIMAPTDSSPKKTLSPAPGLTLTSSLSLDLGQENENDSDTTPLLPSSHRPQTPPAPSYKQFCNYAYFSGVFSGTLWGGLGATVRNVPVWFQFSGAAVISVIAVELLLTQAQSNNPALKKEQARKKMLFNALGAAVVTNSLELLLVGSTGTWAAPLIMIGAKVLAPTVETQLTRAMPQLAANLSSWWNRKLGSDGESKKFDSENEDRRRFSIV